MIVQRSGASATEVVLQPGILGHLADGLPYAQITHDILSTTEDSIVRRRPVELQVDEHVE